MNATYTKTAIILHWLLALAFILMLTSGLMLEYASFINPIKPQMYGWHKSLGVIVLCLVAIRVLWRLTHQPPTLPARFSRVDKLAAFAGHMALYLFMLAMPLSGWALVSSGQTIRPLMVFDLFQWPPMPGVAANPTVRSLAGMVHYWAAWFFIATIVLHILAVVKHRLVDHENILPRMWFAKKTD